MSGRRLAAPRRRRWIGALGAIAVAALVPALVTAQAQTQWTATLVGAQENPPVTTSATGTFTATLNESAGTLAWTLNIPNMPNTLFAHIHSGAVGVNGPVILDLFIPPSGTTVNSINASGTGRAADLKGAFANDFPAFVAALRAGTLYVNAHTTANPGGEIRAQLTSTQATATATATTTPKATGTATATATATAKAATAVPSAPKTGSGGMGDDSRMPLVAIALAVFALAAVAGGRILTSRRG